MSETPQLRFRKSSYSGGGTQNCVEVADLPGAAAVRDSQNPDLGHLVFPATEMTAFLDAVKTGRL
ncbi:DUF397 domain-containing protein [Marinactinospora endophytica]